MIVLGISHLTNPAAALFVHGKLVAFVEEERFSRFKSSHFMFPGQSIRYCLKTAGISIQDVDRIAIPYDASFYPWRFIGKLAGSFFHHGFGGSQQRGGGGEAVVRNLSIAFGNSAGQIHSKIRQGLVAAGVVGPSPAIEYVDHHLSHVASVACFSGFDQAVVVVVDGSGEYATTTTHLYQQGKFKFLDGYEIPDSLGWFYAGITEYLGFKPYQDEGKTMGLAPYGEMDQAIYDKLLTIVDSSGGRYRVDPSYLLLGDHDYGLHFSNRLVALLGEPRKQGQPLQQRHKDIAWAAQNILETVVRAIVEKAVGQTGVGKVCLSGGVAMNCKMNGVVRETPLVEDVFVFPASSDAGACVGAGAWVSGNHGFPVRTCLEQVYYGPEYSVDEMEEVLRNNKLAYRKPDSIVAACARLLEEGKLLGWFQGRMEFGPRALGGRSILANPLLADAKERVNRQVKFREPWRPFCPSMLNEQRGRYLQRDAAGPFMIVANQLRPEWQEILAPVAHVDGSVRPQTVTPEINPLFYGLLSEFSSLTGHGILLNTSLNVRSEPIVCSPGEAVRCFYGGGLDALALGPFLLEKR